MSAIYLTYRHAAFLVARQFWPLLAITLIVQLLAFGLLVVPTPHHVPQGGVVSIIKLAGLLLFPVGTAAILTVLSRGALLERPLLAAYRGVVAYTWSLLRVAFNQGGLLLLLFIPLCLIAYVLHEQKGSVMLIAGWIALDISNAKLGIASAVVVHENTTGQPAVQRSWQMTRLPHFWYASGCYLLWTAVQFLPSKVDIGDPFTDAAIRTVLDACLSTVGTVLTWCIYAHLRSVELPLSETSPTDPGMEQGKDGLSRSGSF